MNVDGILRSKGAAVVTIGPDATVADLVRGLREERIGAMVVSEDGRSSSASSRNATLSEDSPSAGRGSWTPPSQSS